MNHFNNKTLNGKSRLYELLKRVRDNANLYIFPNTLFFSRFLENWYEDRLALEQAYKKEPEKRIVSLPFSTRYPSAFIILL